MKKTTALGLSLVGLLLAGSPQAMAAEVSYSLFSDSLDLRGLDYRVQGAVREGRFSFRPLEGSPEWVELAVSASVDGRPLPPFAPVDGATDMRAAPSFTLVYTNAAARAELTFRPTSTELALRIFRPESRALRTVEVACGSASDATQVFDPSVRHASYHEFPVRAPRSIEPGIASPPPWLFSYRRDGRPGCWSVALEPQPDVLGFLSFGHVPAGSQGVAWEIGYPERSPESGDLVVPPLVFRFGDADFFAALQRHVDDLRSAGKMKVPVRRPPAWHTNTLACTWRYQREKPRREQATEANAEAYVKMLEDNGISFGTLIIDDFWGRDHGVLEADPRKWKDLRGFIDRQHAKGRHVLLWICPEGVGLPDDEQVDQQWNIENPAFVRRLKESLHRLLSSDPGCYDADGLKFDFTAGYPEDFGTLRKAGCDYLRRRFEMVTDFCLAVKPDALLDYQCYNPYFTHTLTMLRLNDYFGAPENGLGEMKVRARIASICAPGAPIDTDHIGYRAFSYRGTLPFFRRQADLGVRSLYLAPDDLKDPELLSVLQDRPPVRDRTRDVAFMARYSESACGIAARKMKEITDAGFATRLPTGGHYDGYFLWDTAFCVLWARHVADRFPVEESLDNFYRFAQPDGYIARQFDAQGRPVWARDSTLGFAPPLLAWAEMELHRTRGKGAERLRRVYPALVRHHRALGRFRRADGLYFTDALGCGMDELPRHPYGASDADLVKDGLVPTVESIQPYARTPGRCNFVLGGKLGHFSWNRQMGWVDTTSQVALDCLSLAEMAEAIGKADEAAAWRAEHRCLAETVNRLCWDEKLGFYCDHWNGGTIPRRHAGGFWALIARIATPERAARIAAAFADPEAFGRPVPLPCLPADDPDYRPETGYWCGGVWPPTNYIAIRGLQLYGYDELAEDIARRWYNANAEIFVQTGTVYENLSPERCDRPRELSGYDFCGWGALAPVALPREFGWQKDDGTIGAVK